MRSVQEHSAGDHAVRRTAGRIAGARVAFVTNMATHYRTEVFAALSRMCDTEFYLYSDGGERYWQKAHGGQSKTGFVTHRFRGFWIGGTRIVPGLISALWTGRHNVFIKCINGRFALPITYLIARLRGVPFIVWATIWHRLGSPFHRLIFPLTRYIYLHADAAVTYGEHGRQYLISEGVDPSRIFLACQSVNNEQYRRVVQTAERDELLKRYNLPPDRKIVLYLGRLEEGKGLEYLLDAFGQIRTPNAALVFCGKGKLEGQLRAQVERLGIQDRVWFTGHVPSNQTVPFYSVSWVSVLPSVTTPTFREPWGLTVNEAFNQGIPVIATDAVGAAAGGLVQNGRNGFVVPERDSSALRDALETVLANEELRHRMGNRAMADVAAWTPERTAAGFRDAVAYVMARRVGRVTRDRAVEKES